MQANLVKYEKDLSRLVKHGDSLFLSLASNIERMRPHLDLTTVQLPAFIEEYQQWYSEAYHLLELVLPARLSDFVSLYSNARQKTLDWNTFTLSDYLLFRSFLGDQDDPDTRESAAIARFNQQLLILKSAAKRFTSTYANCFWQTYSTMNLMPQGSSRRTDLFAQRVP